MALEGASRNGPVRLVLENGGYTTLGDRAQTEAAVLSLRQYLGPCFISVCRAPSDPPFDLGGDEVCLPARAVSRQFGLRLPRRLSGLRGMWRVQDLLSSVSPAASVIPILWAALTRRYCSCSLVARSELKALIEKLNEADALVICGCGGMTDPFAQGGLLPFGTAILAARLLGKPVVLTGQGIGPIRPGPWRTFCRLFLPQVNYLTTREHISLDLARRLGAAAGRCELGADDAHNLAADADSTAAVREFLSPLKRPILTLNLRQHAYTKLQDHALDAIAEGVSQFLRRTGGTLICAPMRTAVTEDETVHEKLMLRLSHRGAALHLPADLATPRALKALQAAADLSLGCTYHFLVFALSACKPAFGLYYSDYYRQKFLGLMEQYGMRAGAIDGRSACALDIAERLNECIDGYDDICEELRRKNADVSSRLVRTYRRLARLVRRRRPRVHS